MLETSRNSERMLIGDLHDPKSCVDITTRRINERPDHFPLFFLFIGPNLGHVAFS